MYTEPQRVKLMSKLHEPGFAWEAKQVAELLVEFPEMQNTSASLGELNKFTGAMDIAIANGLLPPGSTMPELQLEHMLRAPPNYQPTSAPTSTPEMKPFCVHHAYRPGTNAHAQYWENYRMFGRICAEVATRPLDDESRQSRRKTQALDVAITPTQRKLLRPSNFDLTIGSLMAEASRHVSKHHLPERRMNLLGEFPGVGRIANTESRLRRQQTALNISMLFAEENNTKNTKAARKRREKTEKNKKRAAELEATELLHAYGLAEVGEKLTVARMRGFLKTESIKLPLMQKNSTIANLVAFLAALQRHKASGVDDWAARARRELEEAGAAAPAASVAKAEKKRKRKKSNGKREAVSDIEDSSSNADSMSSPSDSGVESEFESESDSDGGGGLGDGEEGDAESAVAAPQYVWEKVLRARVTGKGDWQFLTKWKGFDDKDDLTWEPESVFAGWEGTLAGLKAEEQERKRDKRARQELEQQQAERSTKKQRTRAPPKPSVEDIAKWGDLTEADAGCANAMYDRIRNSKQLRSDDLFLLNEHCHRVCDWHAHQQA